MHRGMSRVMVSFANMPTTSTKNIMQCGGVDNNRDNDDVDW